MTVPVEHRQAIEQVDVGLRGEMGRSWRRRAAALGRRRRSRLRRFRGCL